MLSPYLFFDNIVAPNPTLQLEPAQQNCVFQESANGL